VTVVFIVAPSQSVVKRDERLVSLYWRAAAADALPRFTDEGGGIYAVESRSRKGRIYKVVITPEGAECVRCEAAECHEPCTHLAVCAEYDDETRYFQEARTDFYADVRVRLPHDEKLLKEYRKLYTKFYPKGVEVVKVETVECPF
jgi:hypothetical protein